MRRSDGFVVGQSDVRHVRHGRSANDTVRQQRDRNERGLRAIFPACLMSSSAASLLVVRWLCSWTEEGRRI